MHTPFGLEFGYERAIKEYNSILFNVSASAYDFSGVFGLPKGESIMLNMGFRNYFFSDEAMSGFYYEAEIGAGQAKASDSKYIGTRPISIFSGVIDVPNYARGTSKTIVGGIGLNLGCQKKWDFFSIDLGAGLQYNTPIIGDKSIPLNNGSTLELPNYVHGFRAQAYFGIGFVF